MLAPCPVIGTDRNDQELAHFINDAAAMAHRPRLRRGWPGQTGQPSTQTISVGATTALVGDALLSHAPAPVVS